MSKRKRARAVRKAFGHALRETRLKGHLTQEALALDAGTSRNHVQRLEYGTRQPTLTMIFDLAEAATIDPEELIRLTRKYLAT